MFPAKRLCRVAVKLVNMGWVMLASNLYWCVTLDWLVFLDFDPLGFFSFYFLGILKFIVFQSRVHQRIPIVCVCVFVIGFKVKSYPDLVPCWFQRVELHILYGSLICGLHDLSRSSLGEYQTILNMRLEETWEVVCKVVTVMWELTSPIGSMGFGFGDYMVLGYST